MKNFRPGITSLPLLLLLAASLAGAHHSGANYDQQLEVMLNGVITEIAWANPHVYFMLETEEASGETLVWEIEADSVPLLLQNGVTRDTVSIGERVDVVINPSRLPNRREVRGRRLIKQDGRVAVLNVNRLEQPFLVPAGSTADLSGVWAPVRTLAPYFNARGPNGVASWPLTEAGREAVESFSPSTAPGNGSACGPVPAPLSMAWRSFRIIEIDGDSVSIQNIEPVHHVRQVHMDLDSFDGIPESSLGTSIGRWEDDVLVVETSRFLPSSMGNAQGLPSSAQKHFTERFRLLPEGRRLSYRVELKDPVYIREPVAFSDEWELYGDVDPADLIAPCSEENSNRAFE